MGDDFERLKRDGSRSAFAGQSLETADRDELLAVIAAIGEDQKAREATRQEHETFEREIRRPRYW